jgi:hypothetical protein
LGGLEAIVTPRARAGRRNLPERAVIAQDVSQANAILCAARERG